MGQSEINCPICGCRIWDQRHERVIPHHSGSGRQATTTYEIMCDQCHGWALGEMPLKRVGRGL